MDLAAVMDDIGEALESIDGLRVFPYWAESIAPPAAVVGWPDPLTFDSTMSRGSDEVEGVPVIVMVSKADARSARDQLAAYANGSGTRSVKAVIEAHAATAYDSARVARAEFGVISVGGVEYLAATFSVDLIGQGA
jgi:hypothetical protein